MRLISETPSGGVFEQLFTLGEIPGVLWDDERVPQAQSLALFDALASAEKTLHANPGKHGEVPAFELDSTLRFFARHLG